MARENSSDRGNLAASASASPQCGVTSRETGFVTTELIEFLDDPSNVINGAFGKEKRGVWPKKGP